MATLILGGVLERHPKLDVCISHGGGATSWLVERMRTAAATRPWARGHLARDRVVDDGLGRLWWDAHVGGPAALGMLTGVVGTDHLVGGTNFAGWDQTEDPSFGDDELAGLLDDNARRLLRLDHRGRRLRRADGHR